MAVMVQHAKRIMVSFCRSHPSAIITELIRDLQVQMHDSASVVSHCRPQSVEIISAELQPSDFPPFFCVACGQHEVRGDGEGLEGEESTVRWRSAVRRKEPTPVPLPVPSDKQYFASLKTLLNLPVKQLVPLHRWSEHC